ncbi:MAG: hypothetical protein WC229_03110 [Candidatus Paceibacterota bacterium]|jgi:hypothetical protein
MNKKEIWDNISKQVDNLTDALGMSVDEKIKPVVISLNALGICTSSSCGGHFDDGRFLFPGIICEAFNKPEYRWTGEGEIIESIFDKYKIEPRQKNMIFWPGNEAAENEYYERTRNVLETLEYFEWDRGNYFIAKKAFEIIKAFNEQGTHPEDIKISYGGMYPGCSIDIAGDDLMLKTLTEDILKGKIIKAQKEMDAFGAFLKDTFFNN